MKKSWKSLAAIQTVFILGACGSGPVEGTPVGAESEVLTWEQFRAQVFQEPGSGVFIANGDEVFENEAALRDFYERSVRQRKQGVRRDGLTVMSRGGVVAKWSAAQALNLTYCVSTAFGSRYGTVVAAMRKAAEAWEGAARVDFVHLSVQDSNCNAGNGNVVFDVNPVNVGGAYMVRAFFPDQARLSRSVLIDNTAFSTTAPLTLDGLLRHELGHVLGFRHEYTRLEAGACFEDFQWQALTSYDRYSVMHDPKCNGSGNGALRLTALDRLGAAVVYGSWFRGGRSDHDGDGLEDFVVWRPSTGSWSVRFNSGAPSMTQLWALPDDVPVSGDYDGDRKTDFAVWRPSTGQWLLINSSTGTTSNLVWGDGSQGDRPVPGDYDGDGKTDLAVWRPSTGNWSVRFSSGAPSVTKHWGSLEDVPVPGDYDGDRKTDFAVWQSSTNQWLLLYSSNGSMVSLFWGASSMGDQPSFAFLP